MKKIYISALIITFNCFFMPNDYGIAADNGSKPSKIVKEAFLSPYNINDNIDSPMFFRGKGGIPLIAATAKKTDKLFIYNATNGSIQDQVGSSGSGEVEFKRPNGIISSGNIAMVVERDNHRVQVLRLPGFTYLGTFGDSLLIKPYGIYADSLADGSVMVFVTDCYETANGDIPTANELGDRVKIFHLELKKDKISWEFVKAFGDTAGDGILRVVESIYGDPENNTLLIADEDSISNDIKVYSFDGTFEERTIGKGTFKYQAEGIALWKTGKESEGYWITTDQGPEKTVFHIFDRISFEHKGSFEGEKTANTDGIALTTEKIDGFPEGSLYAINNDGGISAFSLRKIKKTMNLK